MNNSKKLLAIDTATANFSLALFAGDDLLECFVSPDSNKQAELLIPQVEALLARHKWQYADLDFFAANIGPGSFTGLRIGLSVVKAWSLVLRVQAIAVTALEATAWVKGGGEVQLDARRGQAFVQEFDANLVALSAPRMIDCVGEFDATANAESVGRVALLKLATGAYFNEIKPLYIREADAKLPAN